MPFFNSLQCGAAAIRLLYYFERECWLVLGWVGALWCTAAAFAQSLLLFAAIKVKARAKWK